MSPSIPSYNELRAIFGEEQARTVVDFIEIKIEETVKEKSTGLAKASQIDEVKVQLTDFKTLLAEQKSDLLKWMITIYMAGILALTGAIVGLYFR